MSTAIIDYGVGNLGSIKNMLRRIGGESRITADEDVIISADRLILPGVGAFDHCVRSLRERGLEPILRRAVLEQRTPILGICVGMQLFADASEEGVEQGLGWIPGRVVKFKKARAEMKIPHMGWNFVRPRRDTYLFNRMPQDEPKFYFVHSFYFDCTQDQHVLGTTDYFCSFTSAVHRENIWGVQFHPEKSHKFGMQLLANFLEMTRLR